MGNYKEEKRKILGRLISEEKNGKKVCFFIKTRGNAIDEVKLLC